MVIHQTHRRCELDDIVDRRFGHLQRVVGQLLVEFLDLDQHLGGVTRAERRVAAVREMLVRLRGRFELDIDFGRRSIAGRRRSGRTRSIAGRSGKRIDKVGGVDVRIVGGRGTWDVAATSGKRVLVSTLKNKENFILKKLLFLWE